MLLPCPAVLLPTILMLASTSQATLFHSRAVKELTVKNFKSVVQSSEKLTVAAFIAPWCGHCKRLAPEYDKAADNLKGLVNLVAVDCDEEQNKSFCGSQGVQGFPTIKVFPGGRAPSQSYPGAREAKAIVEYATSHMPTFVKRITSASELEQMKEQVATKPICFLFTSASLITPLYKALSTEFHKSIDFYAARESKVGLPAMKAFSSEIEKSPTIIIKEIDGKVTKYTGNLKYEAIQAFLTPYASGKENGPGKKLSDEL